MPAPQQCCCLPKIERVKTQMQHIHIKSAISTGFMTVFSNVILWLYKVCLELNFQDLPPQLHTYMLLLHCSMAKSILLRYILTYLVCTIVLHIKIVRTQYFIRYLWMGHRDNSKTLDISVNSNKFKTL